MDTANHKKWQREEILIWMMSLSDNRLADYEKVFESSLKDNRLEALICKKNSEN